MRLPIEHIAGTDPPQFAWRQLVDVYGKDQLQFVDHLGPAPPTMERALCELIKLAEKLMSENDQLREAVKAVKKGK